MFSCLTNKIVLNRMINVLECINFAHVIQQPHVQRPSTSGLLTRDCTPWPTTLLERRLEYIVNGPRQYSHEKDDGTVGLRGFQMFK